MVSWAIAMGGWARGIGVVVIAEMYVVVVMVVAAGQQVPRRPSCKEIIVVAVDVDNAHVAVKEGRMVCGKCDALGLECPAR